jgi:ribosome-binding protein aMBF1 (putative translation factor)
MKECFRCGTNEAEAILVRAISKEGMVYVCNRCQIKERLPLIKEGGKVDDVQHKMSVRQRLEIMAGIKPKEDSIRSIQHMGEEVNLKDLVERNFQEKIKEADKKVYAELIPNFHWVVMRKRRLAKLTQSELAKKIAEPVSAVQSLEKGVLPKDYLPLIRKIERLFGIFLLKEPKREFVPEHIPHESKVPSGVTIGDLRRMHSEEVSKKDNSIDEEDKLEDAPKKRGFWKRFSKKQESKEDKEDEDDLSPEEMERIIFQRD